jgi:hypothetical protein
MSATRGDDTRHAEAAPIALSCAISAWVAGMVFITSPTAPRPRLMALRDLRNYFHRFTKAKEILDHSHVDSSDASLRGNALSVRTRLQIYIRNAQSCA